MVSLTDGIARIHGLDNAMYGEMWNSPAKAIRLGAQPEQDSVGAVVLGEYEHFAEGDRSSAPAAFWRCRLAKVCSDALSILSAAH